MSEIRNLKNQKTSTNDHNQLFEMQIAEDFLTKAMLAEKLCCSRSYVNKLMRQRKIPFLKIGRSVRFKYSDVVAALQKGSAA